MASFIRHMFKRYPWPSNCVVYGTLYMSAELSQQVLTKRVLIKPEESKPPKPIDTAALARYGVFGTLIAPNILYPWYRWLDSRFMGTAGKTVVKKLLLDQFLCTPVLYFVFYTSMSLMENKTDIFEECRNKFVQTFLTSCCFWLPAQTINFLWIPPAARVVYVGTSSLIWVNILCWIKRQDYQPEALEPMKPQDYQPEALETQAS